MIAIMHAHLRQNICRTESPQFAGRFATCSWPRTGKKKGVLGALSAVVDESWCCGRGLNPRPPPYQGGALPLSYRSAPADREPQRKTMMTDKRRVPCHMGMSAARRRVPGSTLAPKGPVGQKPRCLGPGCRMTDRSTSKSAARPPRADRLGASLRENLKRRKAQAKGRAHRAEGAEVTDPDTRRAPNSAGITKDKPSGNT